MPASSSAIFVLLKNKPDQEQVMAELQKYNGTLLHSSFINKDESQLYAALT